MNEDYQWNEETGKPGKGMLGQAVQVWSVCQVEPTSVRQAATVFNLQPTDIIEAVEAHYWMFLTGPSDDYDRLMIEHEGE